MRLLATSNFERDISVLRGTPCLVASYEVSNVLAGSDR